MLDKLKTLKNKTTSHLATHRAKYAAGTTFVTTAAVFAAVNAGEREKWDEFLESKGLTDEFYNSES